MGSQNIGSYMGGIRGANMSRPSRRPNYALVEFGEHLGETKSDLDMEWAEFVGNRTTERSFVVPTDEATDAYLELQAYGVNSFDHEILINDSPVSGFDIPPSSGWQYWMDAITGPDLIEGENTIQVRRDGESDDNFVVGTVIVHWREPV